MSSDPVPRTRVSAGVLAAATLALVHTAGAATRPHTVPLTVSVTGSGVLQLTGGRRLVCASSCRRTFHIRVGGRVVITTAPASGWKVTTWAGTCRNSAATCSLRLTAASRVSVTIVPPGARDNPYLEGQAVKLDGGWTANLQSAIFNANDQIAAVRDGSGKPINAPPAPGTQYALIEVMFTYVGAGSSNLGEWLSAHELDAVGADNASYRPTGCIPPPADLSLVGDVFAGQTVTGNVCYAIASTGTMPLMLTMARPGGRGSIWFALR
jgi:hypothetical protein